MRTIAAALVALALACLPASAQEQKAEPLSLVQELGRHCYVMSYAGGELTGSGAAFLVHEARSAEFVLIGEDHGIGSVPLFVAAFYRTVEPFGYDHLVIETGPLTAGYVTHMARSTTPIDEFAAFNRAYPFGIPFYFWREEAEMAASAARDSAKEPTPIWGLDQEFIMSPPFHFKRLVLIAPNEAARTLASEYYDRASKDFANAVATKNPGGVFLIAAKPEDFDRLEKAFAPKAGSEAARIIRELRVSSEIYQKNGDGRGYQSNLQRSQLMKEHFMSYYRDALRSGKPPPRAVFKFGAFHMKRGRSATNVFDIGTLASELAESNGSHSFHILVIAATGTQNAFVPFLGNEADKQKRYDVVAEMDFMDVKPVLEAAGATGWSVLDLRPLRPLVAKHKFGDLERGLEDIVFGYDAIVVIHDAKAATQF